ncbi:Uncharacterised protein [Serratia fonticola]|uniref:hypothetical protein n=1 Tax=Serratia fonticola TaxID=47917 RepID=UPI000565ACAC|nr:hypothetical protein [Serratia fonticola]CAI1527670.1 Uncharacterised protein [Serratia fonticola]
MTTSTTDIDASNVNYINQVNRSFKLNNYLDDGYILVSSRDELLAAQSFIINTIKKRTEIRLTRNFSAWNAAKTDIDLAWVTLCGSAEGTSIDASGIPDVTGNYFLRFYHSGKANIANIPFITGHRAVGINVIGPGNNTQVTAFLFDSPEASLGNFSVASLTCQRFGVGMSFRQNAYIISIHHSNIARCGIHAEMPHGYTNYGENITFSDCTLATSGGIAVYNGNPNGRFNLINCSVDYVGQVAVSKAGAIVFYGGHQEFENKSNQLKDTPYVCGSTQTCRIELNSVTMVCLRNEGLLQDYLVNSNLGGDGVYFDKTSFYNIKTASGRLNCGDGVFSIRNTGVLNGSGNTNTTVIQSQVQNLMIDGCNESTNVCDWYISRHHGKIESRTTAENIQLYNNTNTTPRSGKQVLEVTSTIRGVNHGISCIVPVAAYQQPSATLWVKSAGITGNINVLLKWVGVSYFDQLGRPVIHKTSDSISYRTIKLSEATDWVNMTMQSFKSPKPAWATHFQIEINSSTAGVGSYFIDDAGVWTI